MINICHLNLLVIILGGTLPLTAQSISNQDSLLWQLGVVLMLTENYREAEACFKPIAEQNPTLINIPNNQGVNMAMWGLSLLEEKDVEVLAYVFPLQVTSRLTSKTPKDSLQINSYLNQAEDYFQRCIELDQNYAPAYLNLAQMKAIQGRLLSDEGIIGEGYEYILQVQELVDKSTPTFGYSLVVLGIIYDYLDMPSKRNANFRQAAVENRAYADSRLALLIQTNQHIAEGVQFQSADTPKKYVATYSDEPETISGISLQRLVRKRNLQANIQIRDLTMVNLADNAKGSFSKPETATLYCKNYPQSNLFIFFQSVNHFIFVHQTQVNYEGQSSRGIKIGYSKAKLLATYGPPTRIYPTIDGQFLYYRKAKIIFLIQNEKVISWLTWEGKGLKGH